MYHSHLSFQIKPLQKRWDEKVYTLVTNKSRSVFHGPTVKANNLFELFKEKISNQPETNTDMLQSLAFLNFQH